MIGLNDLSKLGHQSSSWLPGTSDPDVFRAENTELELKSPIEEVEEVWALNWLVCI